MAFWVFVLTYFPGSYQAQQGLQSCGFANPFFFVHLVVPPLFNGYTAWRYGCLNVLLI